MRRGHGPAVTAGGKCERIMYAGGKPHTVTHEWTIHKTCGIELITKLLDDRAKKGIGAKNSGNCKEASEQALSKLASEKAETIMAGKREAAKRSSLVASPRGLRIASGVYT